MNNPNMLDPKMAPTLWTREGFGGPVAAAVRAAHTPSYLRVEGPHGPRRNILARMVPKDESSADALPTVIATSREGLRMSMSGRKEAMPFVIRNVECDEVHFVQSGSVRFETEFGELDAEAGDFVFIPRAVAYKFHPVSGGMRSLIIESPWALKVNAPFGVIMPSDIGRPTVKPNPTRDCETKLVVKTRDDLTTFVLPYDPTVLLALVIGENPVWKVNLAKIQTGSYAPVGGPPVQIITTANSEFCVFNLSSRVGLRPPPHLNADYDEFIVYAAGPGHWGACSEPGTITLVPKGVPHQGMDENVPEGYLAWLVECRPTLRWTEEGLHASELMDTSTYGPLGGAKP
ncbi:hypothetical protein [Ferribacterium limneticum]|uniref:hypothetical protein n=1 Tax=Ferribacterium limneticum TaxID=76259 RepID=UPI001CFBD33B|nr:hypothetical protein [Ferribacterium limneticum]UCV17783.1 hypothetical protein KI610_13265 [Ferribacterium limneticum]